MHDKEIKLPKEYIGLWRCGMNLEEYNGKNILMIHNGGERQGLLYKHVCDELGMTLCHMADKPNEHAFGKIAGRLHIALYEEILLKYYK